MPRTNLTIQDQPIKNSGQFLQTLYSVVSQQEMAIEDVDWNEVCKTDARSIDYAKHGLNLQKLQDFLTASPSQMRDSASSGNSTDSTSQNSSESDSPINTDDILQSHRDLIKHFLQQSNNVRKERIQSSKQKVSEQLTDFYNSVQEFKKILGEEQQKQLEENCQLQQIYQSANLAELEKVLSSENNDLKNYRSRLSKSTDSHLEIDFNSQSEVFISAQLNDIITQRRKDTLDNNASEQVSEYLSHMSESYLTSMHDGNGNIQVRKEIKPEVNILDYWLEQERMMQDQFDMIRSFGGEVSEGDLLGTNIAVSNTDQRSVSYEDLPATCCCGTVVYELLGDFAKPLVKAFESLPSKAREFALFLRQQEYDEDIDPQIYGIVDLGIEFDYETSSFAKDSNILKITVNNLEADSIAQKIGLKAGMQLELEIAGEDKIDLASAIEIIKSGEYQVQSISSKAPIGTDKAVEEQSLQESLQQIRNLKNNFCYDLEGKRQVEDSKIKFFQHRSDRLEEITFNKAQEQYCQENWNIPGIIESKTERMCNFFSSLRDRS